MTTNSSNPTLRNARRAGRVNRSLMALTVHGHPGNPGNPVKPVSLTKPMIPMILTIPMSSENCAGGSPVGGDFLIRDAVPSDSTLIAGDVLAGMGYDVFSGSAGKIEIGGRNFSPGEAVGVFREVCIREDTLYSWKRTRVACVGGVPAGTLTAYPSDDYPQLRALTWGLLGAGASSDAEPECRPGEFYLDSLAVLPECRGLTFANGGSTGRIGHLLLLDGIEVGRSKGFSRVSLIVDKSRPRLCAYYSALGFRPDGDVLFFGHLYDRLVLNL